MCIRGDAHLVLELVFGNQLLQSGQHTDLIGGVGRQLPEVMGTVSVALDDDGTVGGNCHIPTN